MIPDVQYPTSANNRTPPNRQTRVRYEFTDDGFSVTGSLIIRAKEANIAGTPISFATNAESDVVIEVLGYLMPVKIKWRTDTYNVVGGSFTLVSSVQEEANLTSSNSFKVTVPYAGPIPVNGTYVAKLNFRIARLF